MEKYKPILEAAKEPLRLLVLAIIPFAIAWANGGGYEWAGIMVVVLRGLDKFLHEIGKEKENEGLIKGLTRF